jgi:Domain of unknown function (DUF4326)
MPDTALALATYVKRRRIKGWKKPDGAVSCTRGHVHAGPWGNPFEAGQHVAGVGEVRDHEHAVELYRQLLRTMPDKQQRARAELAGKILMCWCAPGQPCHVQDVLLPLVNEGVLP